MVQSTDYGVWGDVMREQKSDESVYRFGYQGQFAEKDEETGWSHFELREYDAVIGRWMSVDPKREFFSSYLGMGNNPVSLNDPDGGGVTSTDVRDNCDGTYTVVGGDLTDGDLGIYVVDANGVRTGKIGESLFIDSFYSYDNAVGAPPGWYGTIDINSNEGRIWLNGLIDDTPTMAGYVADWEDYNFKDFNMGGSQGAAAFNHRYRGISGQLKIGQNLVVYIFVL